MNPYRVILKPRAERDLDALPIEIARRIWQKLDAIETNPRPPWLCCVIFGSPRKLGSVTTQKMGGSKLVQQREAAS